MGDASGGPLGSTLLEFACMAPASGAETVELVLDKASRRGLLSRLINHQDSMGMTALMYACGKRDVQSVRMLLDARADTQITNKTGLSVLARTRAFPDRLAARKPSRP